MSEAQQPDMMRRIIPKAISEGEVPAERHRGDASDETWQTFRNEVSNGFDNKPQSVNLAVPQFMGARALNKFEAGIAAI